MKIKTKRYYIHSFDFQEFIINTLAGIVYTKSRYMTFCHNEILVFVFCSYLSRLMFQYSMACTEMVVKHCTFEFNIKQKHFREYL